MTDFPAILVGENGYPFPVQFFQCRIGIHVDNPEAEIEPGRKLIQRAGHVVAQVAVGTPV